MYIGAAITSYHYNSYNYQDNGYKASRCDDYYKHMYTRRETLAFTYTHRNANIAFGITTF